LAELFEIRVLRRIFGPKRDEVTGEWETLHNEELYAFYSSPNIIQVIKSRRDGQDMWHVWGRGEVCTEFRWGNLTVKTHLGDLGLDRRILLKCILKK
jgi:hypothetical protein